MELRVLRNGNLRIGVMLSFILGFGLFGSTFIIPIYTQSMLGWTAQKAGMLQLPSTLFTAFMMPLVARMVQKGVPHKYLIATGMTIFFIYSFLASNILTPDTGSEHFFWILILRGFGMGLLSVPISTMSLSTLKGQQIGQGASFSGMMRQLGGSFGVAMISTFVTRQTQIHRTIMVTKLDATDPNVQHKVQALTQSMVAKGMPGNKALSSAYQLIDFSITKQSTLLSYIDVFLWVGVLFLACVPFILVFIRTSKTKMEPLSASR